MMSLQVRISGQRNVGSLTLVFTGDLSHLGIVWRSNTAGHKQSTVRRKGLLSVAQCHYWCTSVVETGTNIVFFLFALLT